MSVIDQITQMDFFHHAMNYSSKGIIDATCCGAFKRKSVEEANQHVEDLVNSNYGAPVETSGSSSRVREGGMIELNRMTAIEAKLDILMSKMNTPKIRSYSKNPVGTEEGGDQKMHE